MNYTVELSSEAQSYLRRLGPRAKQRIAHRLGQLGEDPFDASMSKPLVGRGGQRSSRIGDLRILYFVDREVRIVDVSDIGPRGGVYI